MLAGCTLIHVRSRNTIEHQWTTHEFTLCVDTTDMC